MRATPPAPERQTAQDALAKSLGCVSCHTATDHTTMHVNTGVILGCTDCHGGDAQVVKPQTAAPKDASLPGGDRQRARAAARIPRRGTSRRARLPTRTYTLLNREAPEFVRFINPGDYRVARDACGACHLTIIQAAERSMMSTSAMLWGGASYNNGILPFKRYIVGEAYTAKGEPATLVNPVAAHAVHDREGHSGEAVSAAGVGDRFRSPTSSASSSAAAA